MPKSVNKLIKKSLAKHAKKVVPKDGKSCRVCNWENPTIHIFVASSPVDLATEIKHFSGIEITQYDEYSKYICQNCYDLLYGCVFFREMCQKTDKILRANERITVDIKIENIECDDTFREIEIKPDVQSGEQTVSVDRPLSSPPPNDPEFLDENESNNPPWIEETKTKPKQDRILSEEDKKKQFLCDICGKTTRSNASLLIHKTIHGSNFPFKCDQCSYQGRTYDLLRIHKRSHLTDKPYKCTQCTKSTTTSSNLAKHMRHVHSTTRPFQCTYCEKSFSYQHDMRRHVRDIHLRQGQVECDICCKKFNTKKILQGHRWKIHKIKGERTGRLPSYLLFKPDEDTTVGTTIHGQ